MAEHRDDRGRSREWPAGTGAHAARSAHRGRAVPGTVAQPASGSFADPVSAERSRSGGAEVRDLRHSRRLSSRRCVIAACAVFSRAPSREQIYILHRPPPAACRQRRSSLPAAGAATGGSRGTEHAAHRADAARQPPRLFRRQPLGRAAAAGAGRAGGGVAVRQDFFGGGRGCSPVRADFQLLLTVRHFEAEYTAVPAARRWRAWPSNAFSSTSPRRARGAL